MSTLILSRVHLSALMLSCVNSTFGQIRRILRIYWKTHCLVGGCHIEHISKMCAHKRFSGMSSFKGPQGILRVMRLCILTRKASFTKKLTIMKMNSLCFHPLYIFGKLLMAVCHIVLLWLIFPRWATYRLMPKDISVDLSRFPTPIVTCTEIIKRFRYSQLKLPRRRINSTNQSPQEAQYQDEFYRCTCALLSGNCLPSPEYGITTHKIWWW